MIKGRLSITVATSLALLAAAQTNAPAPTPTPTPSPFCCPKTQQNSDFNPKSINFVSASLKSDDSNILRCMYQGDQSTYCDYTLIPRDYVDFKYKAGELKTQGNAKCSNNAVPAPSTPKEASDQGLACAPTLCCPPTQDSSDNPPQSKKLSNAQYSTEKKYINTRKGADQSKIPNETVLYCNYEDSATCIFRLDGTLKRVVGSLCHSPLVTDVSSNANCAKPL